MIGIDTRLSTHPTYGQATGIRNSVVSPGNPESVPTWQHRKSNLDPSSTPICPPASNVLPPNSSNPQPKTHRPWVKALVQNSCFALSPCALIINSVGSEKPLSAMSWSRIGNKYGKVSGTIAFRASGSLGLIHYSDTYLKLNSLQLGIILASVFRVTELAGLEAVRDHQSMVNTVRHSFKTMKNQPRLTALSCLGAVGRETIFAKLVTQPSVKTVSDVSTIMLGGFVSGFAATSVIAVDKMALAGEPVNANKLLKELASTKTLKICALRSIWFSSALFMSDQILTHIRG